MVEFGEKASKGRQEVIFGGDAEGRDVLGCVDIGRLETIGNGFELKGGETVEGVGTPGLEQASVVELCVDEGNMKASEMEELC